MTDRRPAFITVQQAAAAAGVTAYVIRRILRERERHREQGEPPLGEPPLVVRPASGRGRWLISRVELGRLLGHEYLDARATLDDHERRITRLERHGG